MKIKKRIIIIIIVIVSLIASFGLGMKYSTTKKYNRDKAYYLQQMYTEIDTTISDISGMKESVDYINENKDQANPLKHILEEFDLMINTCNEGSYYMFDTVDIYILNYLSLSFELIKDSVEGGLVVNEERICYGFWEDKVISENEILFFDSVQKELENIRDSIYDENTKEVKSELSMSEFAQIARDFTWRYAVSNMTERGLKN